MKKKIIPLLLVGSSLIVACNETETKSAADSATSALTSIAEAKKTNSVDAVASVNGKYISKSALNTLEAEITQRSQGRKFPQEQLIEELVRRELLVQDALQKKLDQSADYKERIDVASRSLLSQAALQNALKSNPITDADLKAEYDKEMGASSGMEYKARHILLKDEAEAKKMITKLSAGKDFAELAKANSTGPSAPQGGDLGWFAEGQMVKEFSAAVIALADGKFTTEPVKTQFGWHVILREEARKQTPPPFDSVKEQIRPSLQQKKIQELLDNLEKQAKIEILLKPEVVAAEVTPATNTDTPVEAPALEKAKPDAAVEEVKTDATPTTEVKEPAPVVTP